MPRIRLLLPLLALSLLAAPARAADVDSPQKCADDLITEFRNLEKIWSAVFETLSETTAKEKLPEFNQAVDRAMTVIARMQRFPDPPPDLVKVFHGSMDSIDTHIETITKILEKKNPVALAILQGASKKLYDNPPPSNWLKHTDTEHH